MGQLCNLSAWNAARIVRQTQWILMANEDNAWRITLCRQPLIGVSEWKATKGNVGWMEMETGWIWTSTRQIMTGHASGWDEPLAELIHRLPPVIGYICQLRQSTEIMRKTLTYMEPIQGKIRAWEKRNRVLLVSSKTTSWKSAKLPGWTFCRREAGPLGGSGRTRRR